ncbi:DUF1722 domain-containing protein [Motiliproteus coralliicola]|uniref:DUF1722 domain-containing protein n=1 Tax=Motiliproteus coralliicola TaxID=2283196 RepID=A0A369WDW2_9GAMM|nr:DUF523 and DUF1722 domain-containing protein [Motiliproteus coralliicola]RDE19511.1 DUF1722 domain-containing protein [Motiliproteus coralliicola]
MKLIATSNSATETLTATTVNDGAISVGISSCLLGNEVRYNGGHSHSKLCTRVLAEHFNFRSFCPEVATGLGVPRPTLRLVGDPDSPRMVFSNDQQQDVTDRFKQAVTPMLGALAQLDGYILMKNSPSCGLERVKVYQANGHPHTQRTMGLFTQALKERYPDLPIEEEGRLNDDRLRENFILRVYAHHHFRMQVDGQLSLGRLMAFHRDYKYVLMAHNQREYRALGRLLAQASAGQLTELRDQYHHRFMQAIAKPASRRNHCNVLLHIFGYLKRSVQQQARHQILNLIERYRLGEVNLATPLAMLEHYVQLHGSDYIRAQRYLQPYPARLGLANRL